MPPPAPALIGIGNPHRGDDAVGLLVVRGLRERLEGIATVYECRGEATALIDCWAGAGKVVLVDAARTGRPAGAVTRYDATARRLPADLRQTSSHGFGLAEAVELARALGQLPGQLVIYAIEADRFTAGEGPGAAVGGAVDGCRRRVLAEFAT